MAKNKKSSKQKERDAAAKAARRHPKNETAAVITPPNFEQEDKDLVNASKNPADALSEENPAGIGATSDQAADDLTINTQSADDPPPIISYDLDGTTEIEPDPADDTAPAKSNEEMALEMAAAAAAEDIVPFEQKVTEFCLHVRDNFGIYVKKAHDSVVNGWIAFGAWAEHSVDNLYNWADKQNKALVAKWAVWFPDTRVTKEHLNDTIKEAFVDVADVIGGSYKELAENNLRLTKRIEMLEKAILGTAPRTVSADKLDDLLEALRKGEKTKATTMYATLTGATLKAAKSAVELAN